MSQVYTQCTRRHSWLGLIVTSSRVCAATQRKIDHFVLCVQLTLAYIVFATSLPSLFTYGRRLQENISYVYIMAQTQTQAYMYRYTRQRYMIRSCANVTTTNDVKEWRARVRVSAGLQNTFFFQIQKKMHKHTHFDRPSKTSFATLYLKNLHCR